MTEWTIRLYLFVRVSDNTATNRTAFARAFVNHGSGQSLSDERKMLDSVMRLSVSGAEPAQVFGSSTVAKSSMKDALRNFISGLGQSLWYVTSNERGRLDQLLATNDTGVVVRGQRWVLQDALDRLAALRGLKIIEDTAI